MKHQIPEKYLERFVANNAAVNSCLDNLQILENERRLILKEIIVDLGLPETAIIKSDLLCVIEEE